MRHGHPENSPGAIPLTRQQRLRPPARNGPIGANGATRSERASKAEWQEYRKRRSQAANGTMALKSKHLRVLGLSEPVHLLDIKKAYRQMARDFHPDKFVSEQYSDDKRAAAARQMREVNAAYDWLRSNT